MVMDATDGCADPRRDRHTGPMAGPVDDDQGPGAVRIDRWLWSVRLYKTRSDATKACTGGHVTIDGDNVKPAHKVRVGDRVNARVGQRERIVEVTRLIEKRVGAPIAQACYDDHSPPPPERPLQALFGVREPGTGRPTKKERRQHERQFGRRS